MTWFKENKFLGGLILVTALLSALIVYMGLQFGSSLEERLEEVATAEAQDKGWRSLDPFPAPESAEAKKDSLKALLTAAQATQAKLLAFGPESVENIPLTDFSTGLEKSVSEIRELFDAENALPDRFNLGFETYASNPPKESATGVLNYQREAFDWMFRELEAAGVSQVLNLHRQKLPAESGVDWDDERAMQQYQKANAPRTSSRDRKKPSRGRRSASTEVLPEVAHRMPFELTFRGPEAAVRKFLSSVANSDQYFVEARIARIKNEAPTPEKPRGAVEAEAPDDSAAFGDIGGDDEGGEDAPVSQILNRVSGGEDLTVFLRAEILLFKDSAKFPELK
jgi:hypothetical protein